MLTQAIVRPPAANFAAGLTTAELGPPDYELALAQHDAYCAALVRCGLKLTWLEADDNYPDSTFVEDAAVVMQNLAVLARPGAPSRLGEIAGMRPALKQLFPSVEEIKAPGTLDGGDICETERHLFIGISQRTNESGAQQLAEIAAKIGYSSTLVDIRSIDSLLHLKSGVAYLGENRLAITPALAARTEFSACDFLLVSDDEQYAANCVRVNQYLLIAAGHPRFAEKLQAHDTIELDMSEFQKMDGGLSCLSIRF
jgi:dimethylargininase